MVRPLWVNCNNSLPFSVWDTRRLCFNFVSPKIAISISYIYLASCLHSMLFRDYSTFPWAFETQIHLKPLIPFSSHTLAVLQHERQKRRLAINKAKCYPAQLDARAVLGCYRVHKGVPQLIALVTERTIRKADWWKHGRWTAPLQWGKSEEICT